MLEYIYLKLDLTNEQCILLIKVTLCSYKFSLLVVEKFLLDPQASSPPLTPKFLGVTVKQRLLL